jgi:uncharacterized protein
VRSPPSVPSLLDLIHRQYFYLRLPLVHLHRTGDSNHLALKLLRPGSARKRPTSRYISGKGLIRITCSEKQVSISAFRDIYRRHLTAHFDFFTQELRGFDILHNLKIFGLRNWNQANEIEGQDPGRTSHGPTIKGQSSIFNDFFTCKSLDANLILCPMLPLFMAKPIPTVSSREKTPIPKPRDLPEACSLLRIFLGESDEFKHRPLYRAIVLKAREFHLAGATVFRGPMGYGRSSHLHSANILRLSLDLPIIVEIVDEAAKIEAFLPELEKMMRGGLITMEKAQVFHYRH